MNQPQQVRRWFASIVLPWPDALVERHISNWPERLQLLKPDDPADSREILV
jgi:hypothetical protein